MGVTVKSLGIENLDVEDRLALIGELWDSVASETESLPLPTELKNELDRRIEEADNNPEASLAWDDVKAEAYSRIKK